MVPCTPAKRKRSSSPFSSQKVPDGGQQQLTDVVLHPGEQQQGDGVLHPGEQQQGDGVESLGALANALREQNLEVFKKLDHLTALNRVQKRKVVMKKGELPCERALCLLCGAKKHHVKWMCKDGHCTGGTCYACFRASIVLDVSRSPTLITESGASGVELRGSLRP
ncbi:unnamed protein product [Durusdinium trenchii]|uniref:Uncharacterized protein n=1 Tax=Durusdinium trenchii TaxID=1381693 RepID=A0ABP0IHE2_9DINO